MSRGLSYKRRVRNKTISRKKSLCKSAYGWDWYEIDGKYAKGKIDCSCGICKPGKLCKKPTKQAKKEIEIFNEALLDYYNAG